MFCFTCATTVLREPRFSYSKLADYMVGCYQCTERLSRPSAQGQKDFVGVCMERNASWSLEMELGIVIEAVGGSWSQTVVNSPLVD